MKDLLLHITVPNKINKNHLRVTYRYNHRKPVMECGFKVTPITTETCTWTEELPYQNHYGAACCDVHLVYMHALRYFEYCPYCGKKIYYVNRLNKNLM